MDAIIWNSGSDTDTNLTYRYLGAYKVAHSLRSNGFSVQIIDHITRLTDQELYSFTKKFITSKTEILAISTTFLCQENYKWPGSDRTYRIPYSVYTALKTIKEEHPRIRIILGGYMAGAVSGWGLVDASVIHYGEDIFLELMEHLRYGKDEPRYEIRNPVPNVTMKMYTDPRNPRHNIQHDNHIFADNDCIVPGETLPIEVSRGCMFHCKFCNHLLLGRKKLDYLRDFELIRNEMLHNESKWGVKNYYVICDTFNDTTIKMEKWHDMVKSLPFDINFTAYLRADLLHRFTEIPALLKESGLLSAFHGLESLQERASSAVGKGWSGKHAREWIPTLYHDIWKGEVFQTLGFIIGLPGDRREDIVDTVKWFIKNDLNGASFTNLSLNRGSQFPSEFEKDYEKYGYRFKDGDDSNWYTDYWSKTEVIKFNDSVITPMIVGNRSLIGSWDVLSAMTYGYNGRDLSKKNLLSIGKKDWWKSVAVQQRIYIEKYKTLLLSI